MAPKLSGDEVVTVLEWLVRQHLPQGANVCDRCHHAPAYHRPMCTFPLPAGPDVPLCDCPAWTLSGAQ